MKIAILSDSHDNLPNLEKTLSLIKKGGIKMIIHCGDVCGIEAMEKIKENFKGKIHLVFGNADFKDLKEKIEKGEFKSVEFSKDFKEVEIGNLKIAFSHTLELARKLCQAKKYDFVFYGHSHKPWLEKIGNCILANPGNLAGLYFRASFAILETDTKKLSLKTLEEIK